MSQWWLTRASLWVVLLCLARQHLLRASNTTVHTAAAAAPLTKNQNPASNVKKVVATKCCYN